MAASNTTLPNPYTPMAFIPPELETKTMGLIYATVGSFAVLLWDIILHLPQDYKLAARYRINIVFIIYCISRVASLAYVLGLVIAITAPIGDCDVIRQVTMIFPFTIPCATLLCAIRVCGLYGNNKYVVAFFSMTWVVVVISCVAVPLGTIGLKTGTTKYCFESRTTLAHAFPSLTVLVHDGLIFIATSWAFMRNSYCDVNVKNGIRVMVFGRYLPSFSKSMLRDGQAYIMATLLLNLFYAVLSYIPQSPIYPCTIGVPFFVIMNTMSSHLYRNVRLESHWNSSITSFTIDRAVQGVDQSSHHHTILFQQSPTATKMEISGDLEAGDVNKTVDSSVTGLTH